MSENTPIIYQHIRDALFFNTLLRTRELNVTTRILEQFDKCMEETATNKPDFSKAAVSNTLLTILGRDQKLFRVKIDKPQKPAPEHIVMEDEKDFYYTVGSIPGINILRCGTTTARIHLDFCVYSMTGVLFLSKLLESYSWVEKGWKKSYHAMSPADLVNYSDVCPLIFTISIFIQPGRSYNDVWGEFQDNLNRFINDVDTLEKYSIVGLEKYNLVAFVDSFTYLHGSDVDRLNIIISDIFREYDLRATAK